jgi:hypothetical protein
MSAIETFTFNGYTLRPARESDRDLANEWTFADPEHRSTCYPGFWLEQKPTRDSYLLLDAVGPVFFFKLHRKWHGSDEVEFHIQFMPPSQAEEDRSRTRGGMTIGMQWLERVLVLSGIREVTFVSNNLELVSFCKKRLGFVQANGHLAKTLSVAEAEPKLQSEVGN